MVMDEIVARVTQLAPLCLTIQTYYIRKVRFKRFTLFQSDSIRFT